MEEDVIKKINEFVQKANQIKKEDKLDLSSDEDLSLAIMNLVSIEEHFFFTGMKTGEPKYFDFLREVREMRKDLLKKIVKKEEGEVWCLSKHLLAASMRLLEVGTKRLGLGKKEEADDFFQKAYNLYSLFWGLNLNLVSTEDIKKIDENALNKHDQEKKGFLGKLGDLVKKIVNCCVE
ncbi:MAG: hypothetical protein COY82_01215 [Parcubacteria group bacterium CG_4_10_14_0_8_um_filter_35_7]|nr:MAG: hypothetical protein COY82_01215 [Parcubacteria group bacterium CG_4_10_14_0_8_um_filter_35_7]